MYLFQVLVALACDLELDKLIGVTDNHKWLWFRRYCHAARVAKALIHRTQLPKNFCLEVRKKFTESNDQEVDEPWDHEKHNVFKKEHDEQLLAWLNRSVFSSYFYCKFIKRCFLENRKIGLYRGVVQGRFLVGATITEGS